MSRRLAYLDVVAALWCGIAVWQGYRAYQVCTSVSVSTQTYWIILGASVIAGALGVRAVRTRSGGDTAVVPVLLVCIGSTVALRLIELCAAPARLP